MPRFMPREKCWYCEKMISSNWLLRHMVKEHGHPNKIKVAIYRGKVSII